MKRRAATAPYMVLEDGDYAHLGPEDFGAPDMHAVESVGPYATVRASGPLITVHESTLPPHRGIGHHPHRYNERLFYIMTGQLDHDDAQNRIHGHMEAGDVALFTEGRRGMLHSEWNHGDAPTHLYMLVYAAEPVPEQAEFTGLRDADAPRYEEARGVATKEIVGPRSSLRVHGDLRLVTDSVLDDGAALTVALGDGEGALLSVQEGSVHLDGRVLAQGAPVLAPALDGGRTLALRATGRARVLRVVHGPGYGFVRQP